MPELANSVTTIISKKDEVIFREPVTRLIAVAAQGPPGIPGPTSESSFDEDLELLYQIAKL